MTQGSLSPAAGEGMSRARKLEIVLLTAIAACLALLWLRSHSASNATITPVKHVLLITIDTQRADHLSCYGNPRATTPNIDALAAQGVLFEQCVSQASWTLPSMVSVMTGRYVAEEMLHIPADAEVLAEQFKAGGFATGAFICNDLLSPENGFARGFDECQWNLVPYGSNEPILKWLAATKGKPSFTFVHLNEVHDPYDPKPEEKWRHWRDEHAPNFGFSKERLAYYDRVSSELKLVDKDASLARMQAEIGGYDDDTHYSDARIGEILDEVQRLGLSDSTAIVISADHGEGLFTRVQFPIGTRKKAMDAGEPMTLFNTLHMTHGSGANYELIHVPLIIKAPGLSPARVKSWVENVDIAPTLLELAGLLTPTKMQGTSLLALAADPGRSEGLAAAVFSTTRYNSSVIDQKGWQLILPSARGDCDFGLIPELYDLNTDPEARVDLAGRNASRAHELELLVMERLRQGLNDRVAFTPSSATQKSMATLGYVSSEILDQLHEELLRASTDELIAKVREYAADCLLRREALKALALRELSAEQRGALQALSAHELSRAVQLEFERVLGKRLEPKK